MTLRQRYILKLLAVAALLGLVLVAGCTATHPQSTFDARGPVAERQLDLFLALFWVALIVFVVVEGALVYTVLRYRRKRGQGTPAQVHGSTKLEIAWTLVPILVLAGFAVPTVGTQFYISNPPSGERLEVNVTAYQWWWQIEYPDSGVVTANEIHVPVGTTVDFTLESKDVIHSFWVPKLGGKMDMIPGRTNSMWFAADDLDADPTTPERDPYYGQCAEFCGTSHAWMRFRVFVDTQEEFDAWTNKQLTLAAPADGPLARTGADLFLSKGCVACHTISGLPGAVGTRGPNLTHLGGRATLASGIMDLNAENMATWLRDPEAVKVGNIMSREAPVYRDAGMALTETDITALSAFLLGLE